MIYNARTRMNIEILTNNILNRTNNIIYKNIEKLIERKGTSDAICMNIEN